MVQVGAGAWHDVIGDPLAARSVKPRSEGRTMVIDKGMGLGPTADLLNIASEYIDYWKLPFGTSALYPRELLQEKVASIRRYGVHVYPGGTFLEIAVLQDRLEAFIDRVVEIGFDAAEVSDGTVEIPPAKRREAIHLARAQGLVVLTEVGRKDPTERLGALQIHRTIT